MASAAAVALTRRRGGLLGATRADVTGRQQIGARRLEAHACHHEAEGVDIDHVAHQFAFGAEPGEDEHPVGAQLGGLVRFGVSDHHRLQPGVAGSSTGVIDVRTSTEGCSATLAAATRLADRWALLPPPTTRTSPSR